MIQLTHQITETILWDMDNINIHFISCLNILGQFSKLLDLAARNKYSI